MVEYLESLARTNVIVSGPALISPEQLTHYHALTIRDVGALGDVEGISGNFILAKVFQKLHGAFARQMQDTLDGFCALSFPEYQVANKATPLGTSFQVLGREENLAELKLDDLLKSFSDYVQVTSLRCVPPVERIQGYVNFSRVRERANPSRLARRYCKRHPKVSYEEALALYEKKKREALKLPYINLHSSSTSNQFKLFIRKREAEEPQSGLLNSYGLSSSLTVPLFR